MPDPSVCTLPNPLRGKLVDHMQPAQVHSLHTHQDDGSWLGIAHTREEHHRLQTLTDLCAGSRA